MKKMGNYAWGIAHKKENFKHNMLEQIIGTNQYEITWPLRRIEAWV